MTASGETHRMDIRVLDDRAAAGPLVADLMIEIAKDNPDAAFGVATGSSPETVYAGLRAYGDQHPGFFDGCSWWALDEYVGLPESSPQTYANVLAHSIGDPLGLPAGAVHVPPTGGAEPGGGAAAYEQSIRDAEISLQLLGIGRNGHIGFNEPGSHHDSVTRVVTLAEATRRDNSRYFESIDEVPRQAVTQGIATILHARRIVLLAFGEGKAEAVRATVEGPVTEDVPASALRGHADVILLLDPASASLLSEDSLTQGAPVQGTPNQGTPAQGTPAQN